MLKDLQELLDTWGVRHFRAAELCTERRTGNIAVPPRQMWGNIRPALMVADSVREILGVPILVLSGYRSPDYNATVRGSMRSEHMQFKALDLRPMNASVADLERMRLVIRAIIEHDRHADGGRLDLRLLHYDTFVHVDSGAMPGKPRTGPKLDFRS